MAWFSSMSGLLPAVVLVLVALTGAGSSVGGRAAAESDFTPGVPGSWVPVGGAGGGWVWAMRGRGVVLPCLPPRPAPSPREALGVTWLKNNVSVQDRRHVVTAAGHLNITKVIHRRSGITDEGEYRCLVTTPAGVITSAPITLRVASLTKNFVVSPSNVTVLVGEALRLSCQIDSQPPASLLWTQDQQPLPQHDRYTTPFSGVLHIVGVQASDAGTYRCLASNTVLSKDRRSSSVTVTVLEAGEEDVFRAPSFLSPKKHLRVRQGEDAVLECLTTGLPLPNISWQRKLNMSEGEAWEDLTSQTNGLVMGSYGTLTIPNAQNTSAGRYACTAKSLNPITKSEVTISQEIELDIMVPPEIISPPEALDTLLAKTARLDCMVVGNPPPRVTWYKDGLTVNTKGRIIQTSANQLVFTNSITSDTGLYQCLAHNDAGYASSWAPMVINSSKNHPDPPQNLHYVVLSSTSVLLTWDAVLPTSEKIKAYSIHYFESDADEMERQAVSQNTSHLLENLKPNTKYTAFVRAYTNFPSDQSERLVFSTAEDVPKGAPVVQVTPISPTVLLVTWKKLPPEQAQGNIVGYKIHWRKHNHHYYHVNEVLADIHQFEIRDLFPAKKYEVQVLAGTKAGYPTKNNWPWMPIRMPSRTPRNVPLPPVVTLKVVNDTSQTNKLAIKINWKLPAENKAEVEGYMLKYRRQERQWKGPINLPPSQTSYTINNLEADWYEVQVKAFSVDGDGGATEQIVHTMPPNPNTTMPPTASWNIYQLEADPRSQTSIHLSWHLAEGQEGAPYYTIKYQQVSLSTDATKEIFACSETPETVITGLKPFSTYEFRVRAHESDTVYGPYSPAVQAITMGSLPSAPEEITYEPTDASTIRLKWETPDNQADDIKKYEILFTLDKKKPLSKWEVQEVDGETDVATVKGLISNTEYWFMVRSCTVTGCGTATEPLAATIPAILPSPPDISPEILYLICGLVAFVFVFLIVLITVYIIKYRNVTSQPRVLSCNGNGHINGKRVTAGASKGRLGGPGDSEGQEMEVYVPMLTQIPPDFKSPPLDTKGGYPDTWLNGLSNSRCNGYVQSREHSLAGAAPSAPVQGGSEEEKEQLVFGAGSSNGATAQCASSSSQPPPSSLQAASEQSPSSRSPTTTPPPSPAHHLNHSTTSHDGLNNVTSLTTLSVAEGEGGAAPDRTGTDDTSEHITAAAAAASVTTSTPYHHLHHHHHHAGAGATRAASPRPSLTMAQ
ncbi:protogenin B-like [Portunus trituberculatus]|uniref:protogenin B-like n=1 Tax=Portunus trituberculatus TaxID=210409 RepID=UPI001E1CDA2D|nr:protogenin B-like [Portunus trituberculatus]